MVSSLADATEVEGGAVALSRDLDILIDILKRKGASFSALYHRSKEGSAPELPKPEKSKSNVSALSDEMLFTETGSAVSAKTRCEIVGEPVVLGEDMMKYARESRVSANADDNQDVLHAIVWVLRPGKQLFRAYAEVMFIEDGRHKTNKENRRLITMGIKD